MKLVYPTTITADNQPDVRPIAPGMYRLFGHYDVHFECGANFYTVRVPDGFRSDLASIPPFLWGLFGMKPDGLHRAAAIVHDYLCSTRGLFVNVAFDYKYAAHLPSREVHKLFGELLKAADVPPTRRYLMTRAVRVFGPRWSRV